MSKAANMMSNFVNKNEHFQMLPLPEIQILRGNSNLWICDWNIHNRLVPFWFLFWNKTEGAELIFQNRVLQMTGDIIVLIPPLTLFSTRSVQPFKHFFVEFKVQEPFINLQKREFVFQSDEYIDFLESQEADKVRTAMNLYALLFKSLLNIPKESFQVDADTPGINPRIVQALEIMAFSPKKECSNSRISKKLNMSESNFVHLFRNEIGISPQRYFLNLQLEKSYSMLNNPECDINEISQKTGFADRYHFSKAFKRRYKISPAALRNQLQKKK